jgi:hypothetical protein
MHAQTSMRLGTGEGELFAPLDESPQADLLRKDVQRSRNGQVKDLFEKGFGIHHAGMLRSDRNLTERLFSGGHIKVLCCTATLAWGVNLPAHTVIIKGTQARRRSRVFVCKRLPAMRDSPAETRLSVRALAELHCAACQAPCRLQPRLHGSCPSAVAATAAWPQVYDSNKGRFADLGVLDVQQIFGRAGRPQFDTLGEAHLLTTHDKLAHYLAMLTHSMPIESQFIKNLPDNLNAEVVLGTVASIREASTWLSYSYLYVRMTRNPLPYGLTLEELAADPHLVEYRRTLLTNAAKVHALALAVVIVSCCLCSETRTWLPGRSHCCDTCEACSHGGHAAARLTALLRMNRVRAMRRRSRRARWCASTSAAATST